MFIQNYISFKTIVRKEVRRVFRIWIQTLLPPVITMGLYLLIFGRFIGSQLRNINGVSYMEFIIPGIIMMSVITNSYSNVVSSFFSAKMQRNIEEILISSTSPVVTILGYCVGGITRGLLIGSMVTVFSLFFAKLHIYNFAIVFVFIFLTSAIFTLAGMINAIFAKKPDDISIIPTFVLTPLTYLSGVFYSISLLPPFWQFVSKLNPILYMVNGFRYGFLGFSDINIVFGLCMLLLFAAILFTINIILLKKGLGLKT
jgi:ABC-2 type transport system permease protein